MADPHDAQTDLGAKLRSLREGKGWSRETLAKRSGTTPLTILRAEIHGSEPTLASLQRWANALGVPVADLLPGAEVAS